ncbi:hypothetical protein ACJVC5_13025 [Peredibacter sp. HCB2-198]|uniref:hypothetical protein n=1 Tax=Peredibacter sp. HCB2-198 TaxID=3383025 RepID=UPI0038B6AA07
MKIFVVFCSLFLFISQAWALGSRGPGLDPANSEAMGSSAATLNQVTPESDVDQATEEQEEQRMQEMQEQQNSPELEEDIEESRYDVVPKN